MSEKVNSLFSQLVFWTIMIVLGIVFMSSESGMYFFGNLGRELPRGNYFDNFARLTVNDHLYYYPGEGKFSLEFSNVVAILFPLLWMIVFLLGLTKRLDLERIIYLLCPMVVAQVASVALTGTAPVSFSEVVFFTSTLIFTFVVVAMLIHCVKRPI